MGGEWFGKYVGIQGVLALLFGLGYVVAPFAGVVLPDAWEDLMLVLFGFYFAKNGGKIINAVRGNGGSE